MIQINKDNLPMFPGQDTRPANPVDASALKEIGVNMGIFGVRAGDTIQFAETNEPIVYSQNVRANDENSPKAYYVACLRSTKDNTTPKESWVGIGTFTRRDANGQPIGELQERCLRQANFAEVYANILSGKTVMCDKLVEKEMAAFDRTTGRRLSENRKSMVPHLVIK